MKCMLIKKLSILMMLALGAHLSYSLDKRSFMSPEHYTRYICMQEGAVGSLEEVLGRNKSRLSVDNYKYFADEIRSIHDRESDLRTSIEYRAGQDAMAKAILKLKQESESCAETPDLRK